MAARAAPRAVPRRGRDFAPGRYHRLSSFHTYLVRITAYLQGVFFLGLFFWGYQAWLFYGMWVVACAGQAEEWVLLALLPEWTHDVRGLYWVLKARRG